MGSVPETSHEKGRRQLFSFMRFLCGIPSSTSEILEIGNSYQTAATAVAAASEPRGPMVLYDGVARISASAGPSVTCYIESKFCGTSSTVSKLKQHLEDFVVNAYCVLEAWSDNPADHLPNFLFVTNAFPKLHLVDEYGRLNVDTARSVLIAEGITTVDDNLTRLSDSFTFIHYSDWLQSAGV